MDSIISPLISIIVPVFNAKDYISNCIRSILCQSYANFELILVDDGSTDGSGELCDFWSKRDGRIKSIHQRNSGQSAGRNKGLSLACGEYILFVDSDDYISPCLLQSALSKMIMTDSEVCIFKHALVSEDGGDPYPYPEDKKFPSDSISDGHLAVEYLISQKIHCYAWIRLVRSELYKRIGFFFPEGRLMEDMSTTLRVLGEAKRVCYIQRVFYYYRQRKASTVGIWKHQLTVDAIAALDEWYEYIVDRYPDLRVKLLNYDIKFTIYCWVSEPKIDPTQAVHRKELERRLRNRVAMLGIRNLSTSNMIKLLALNTRTINILTDIYKKLKS